jgi:hypothetical protein
MPVGVQALPEALGGATAPAAPAVGQAPAGEATPAQPTAPTVGVLLDEPTKADPAPNPDTSNEFSYDPTGDAGLDYALNFVGKLGYGDTHPAIMAAQKGDFSLIRAELATKGVAGGDAVLALAEQAYTRFAAEDAKKSEELSGFAAQAAGSAENWSVVRAWAAQEATPQEKAQVNAALAQGGLVAQGVITQLVNLYQQKHTLPKDAASVAKPGAVGTGAAASGPMTAQAYAMAVEALRQKYGSNTDSTAEYAALQSQRLAARRAGY